MRPLPVLLIIFIILFSFAAGDDGPGMLLFYLSLIEAVQLYCGLYSLLCFHLLQEMMDQVCYFLSVIEAVYIIIVSKYH